MIKFIFKRFKRFDNNKEKSQIIKQQTNFDKKLVFSLSKSKIPTRDQFKYFPKFLGRREKWVLTGLIFVFCASLIFLGGRIYFFKTEAVPDFGGEYAEGLVGAPQYINPILAQTNDVDADLAQFIFSGLFKYNEKQELVSDLVSNFEVSDDKKEFTFHLKDNLQWHDGENLTASDVVFTISSIQDPSYRSPLYSSFKGVQVEKVDEKTVRFKLEEPYAPFLGMLTFGILPEHLWYNIPAQSANLADYNIKPIGSGPFKFKSLTKDKSGSIKVYTLARNENYYGKKPFLKKLIFKFYPDFQSAAGAMRDKSIEGLGFAPEEIGDSLKSRRYQKYSLSLPQYTAIFFNQKNNEVLKDSSVRKALVLGVPKEKLVAEALGGEGEVIFSPILPGYIGYSQDVLKINLNLAEAADILEKAGFKLEEGGKIRKKDNKNLKIVLTTAEREEFSRAAEIIKGSWESLGVEVELKEIPASQVQREVIRERDYEALLFGVIVGFDPDPFSFWHSSQVDAPGLNLSLYANRKADKLLEEARQIDNPEERAKKYLEFQNILAEDIPAIFLYVPRHAYIVDKDIRGIEDSRINVPSGRFANIENWYKKTKRKWK
jgi:peptide/nickel transport system substrate-binding protein